MAPARTIKTGLRTRRAFGAKGDLAERVKGVRLSTLAMASAAALAAFAHGADRMSLSPVPQAFAQGSQGQLTSRVVTEAFFEAQTLVDENEDYQGAIRVIQRVLDRDDLTPYERGIMLRTLANFQLELEQYEPAIRSLEGAVATGAFIEDQLAELYFFLGGLYLSVERFDDAIRVLEQYFELTPEPGAGAYYLLAQAYAIQERWRDALPRAERAVELTPNPNEGYLRLLVTVYIALGDWAKAVPLLETIITQFPDKDIYWQQLAAGYQELGREKDAYAVIELRYKLGFLTRSRELVTLAELHSFYGYPFKAAKLLESELEAGRIERTSENLEKLGNFWLASREYAKARTALIAASELAPNGRLDFLIAGTFAQDEEWAQAERYLNSALRRGGLNRSQEGSAWLLLGHSRSNQGRRRQALEAFRRAANYSNAKRDAETWIEFLEEQIRVEAQNEQVNAIQTLLDLSSTVGAAITDLELIRDVAIQARETAERAREATSDIERDRALDEYEIRNEEATNRLTDQRVNAETDAETAREAIDVARRFDLPSGDVEEIERLEKLIVERINLVTVAENNLRQAADIIEELTGNRPATPNVPDEEAELLPVPGAASEEGGEGEAAADETDGAAGPAGEEGAADGEPEAAGEEGGDNG